MATTTTELKAALRHVLDVCHGIVARITELEQAEAGTMHPDAVSPVPDGYDTVLGYLAKRHPDVLDCFDYSDPQATTRDGWWLHHRTKQDAPIYVRAPECLKAHGIEHVRAYPIAVLETRWG